MKTFKSFLKEQNIITVDFFDIDDAKKFKDSGNVYDVESDVDIHNLDLSNAKIKFNIVGGNFTIVKCNLSNLDLIPKEVSKDSSEINLNSNNLTNLKGCPNHVESFRCKNNKLVSLEGSPKIVNDAYVIGENRKLTSLEHIAESARCYDFSNTGVESLENIHKCIKKAEVIIMNDIAIRSGGIGLILIDGLKEVLYKKNKPVMTKNKTDFALALKIIKKYLGKGKAGLLECQEELEEAGLEAFAKL